LLFVDNYLVLKLISFFQRGASGEMQLLESQETVEAKR